MKKVDVYFCTYEPYEFGPTAMVHVGTTSLTTANNLLNTLETTQLSGNQCINAIFVQMHRHVRLPNTHTTNNTTRNEILEVSELWTKNYPTLRCESKFSHPFTDNALKKCAANLAAGKCVDECMCRTLGVTLFPKLYARYKQK